MGTYKLVKITNTGTEQLFSDVVEFTENEIDAIYIAMGAFSDYSEKAELLAESIRDKISTL